MPGLFEEAPSGRSKCRGCGAAIAKGDVRFGERVPNAFGEGEMSLWFHPLCAAFKRPEPLLETLESASDIANRDGLEAAARHSLSARRLPRLSGAERAKSGQAKCRHCKEPIAKEEWRLRVVFYEEGRFEPGGFIHLGCRTAYFETDVDLSGHILQFSPDLDETQKDELRKACAA